MVTAQATYTETESVPMEENKEMQHYTCTAVPAVVYHAVLLATEIIPATCPWYTRTPERTQKKKKRKEKQRKIKQRETRAQRPGQIPRGQICCLLVRSVLRYFQLMDQQKDDTKRPKTPTSSPMSSWRAKSDTNQTEGRD